MKKVIGILGSAALGAAAMYVLDPQSGKGRRAVLKDKATSLARKEGEMMAKAGRDLKNRAMSIRPRLAAAMRRESADDRKVAQRICSKAGRALTYPGAVEVSAKEGRITLRGDILKSEVPVLLSAAESCKGVSQIDNQLRIHDAAEGIPALQGTGRLTSAPTLAPGPVLAVGAIGAAAAAYGARKRGPLGAAIGEAGMGLVAKSVKDIYGARS
jgi:hypothetical protein